MKRIFQKLLITGLFLGGFLSVYSQGSNQSILSIGTKHGVNFSEIIFDPTVSQKLTVGYTGGIVLKYISQTHAGIQAEINYSQRGWTEDLDSSSSYSRKLTYFELPILTHFVFGKNKTQFILNIGPNFSYLNTSKEEFSLTKAGDTLSYYMRKPDRDFELALVGGIGMNRITPIGDFQLEFRFHYGLQSIFSSNIETNLAKSQNLLYSVTLSYFFFKKDFRSGKKD